MYKLKAESDIFSSTAYIVSGAYPMPSRPSSVRPSVHQPFFKSNGLPQFSSDLSNIWRECAQQYYIVQNVVEVKILFFASNFFNGSLITKIG